MVMTIGRFLAERPSYSKTKPPAMQRCLSRRRVEQNYLCCSYMINPSRVRPCRGPKQQISGSRHKPKSKIWHTYYLTNITLREYVCSAVCLYQANECAIVFLNALLLEQLSLMHAVQMNLADGHLLDSAGLHGRRACGSNGWLASLLLEDLPELQ